MRTLILFVLLSSILGCTSCKTTTPLDQQSSTPETTIGLRSDLSAADFRAAIIGKWKSPFTCTHKQNIKNLEFTSNGNVRLVFDGAGKSQQHSGLYTTTFDGESDGGTVTFATITIHQQGLDPIILHRVGLYLHNVLRIDQPYGVLIKRN